MARLEALTQPAASTRKATAVNTTTIQTSAYTPMRALRTARTVTDDNGRPTGSARPARPATSSAANGSANRSGPSDSSG